ncbi:MAG: hypothetical protein CMD33_01045 [Flavobacteriales bacterium]|nr:hypothetical protein [Flavobacteriales bacterium]
MGSLLLGLDTRIAPDRGMKFVFIQRLRCLMKPRIFSGLLQDCKAITGCYKDCYGESMPKAHVGHHLLRVRIRRRIFEHMQEVAEYESDRTGEHVTVSDLVRQACVNLLVLHETMRSLHELPDLLNVDLDEDDWEEVLDFDESSEEDETVFEPFVVQAQRL